MVLQKKPELAYGFNDKFNAMQGYKRFRYHPRELCKHWDKTIVHRDEFMKRWNDSNTNDEVKTPQQRALEKFGTDWHDNEGVQPVDDEVLIDAIVETGTLMRQYRWKALGLLKIQKWRI